MPLPAYRSGHQHHHQQQSSYRDRSRSRLAVLLSPSQRKQLLILVCCCLVYSYCFFRLQPDRSFERIQQWNTQLKLEDQRRQEQRQTRRKKKQRFKHPEEIIPEDEYEYEEEEEEEENNSWLQQERQMMQQEGNSNSSTNYLRGSNSEQQQGETQQGYKQRRHKQPQSSASALVDFIFMMVIFTVTRTCVRICLYYRDFREMVRDQQQPLLGGTNASNTTGNGTNRANRNRNNNRRGASLARMVVPQSVHAHAMLLRNARFRNWVTQLNRERQQNGQPPLSLESLRLVLRDRDFSGDDYEALMRFHEEATIAQSMGATQAEIDRCPQRTVTDPDDDLLLAPEHSSAHHCAICLEMYQMGDRVRTLPCFHAMHAHCIDPWLRHRAICPVCKHPANGGLPS